ncbi:MAG TPA: potassium transporter TrkG, partial [Hyphomicrobiales bacterium]|nr:potassium transporter TrkG [Hyphomicrobiales bacterium]
MNFIVFVNGVVLLFLAALMGIDALIFKDTIVIFGVSALLTGFLGLILTIAASSSFEDLRRSHTFLLTSSVWMTAALAGALPLYLWSMPPVDAIFEAMSGITTTGSTVMTGLDQTARGILLWRAMLQALGGVGFIVTGIALLPILKVGGMQLFQTESSDKGEKVLSSATKVATATLLVYLGLIALCAIAYLNGGMSFFDAVTHAMTTLSTGGYSNYDASFGHFDSPFLQWSATLFMLLGALPFVWYIRAITKRVFGSEQVTMMLWSLSIVILALTIWLSQTNDIPAFTALRLVAFSVVSIVTTTGYAVDDYTVWGTFAVAAFVILTAVG